VADQLTQRQALALIDELESATKLLDLGIGELHALDLANDFYHLPMQMLAQGLERFLKVTYAMAELGGSGALPTRDRLRTKYGHDLVRLTDDLVQATAGAADYVGRPAVREDLSFISSQSDLRRILALLSEFGKESRYHRLDEFLDPASAIDDDPYRKWQEFEMDVIRRQPEWLQQMSSTDRAEQLRRDATAYAAYLLDRFARALARMWTLGALPDEANRYMGLAKRFLFLQDDQLGLPRRR
jgi:hypothetical protein